MFQMKGRNAMTSSEMFHRKGRERKRQEKLLCQKRRETMQLYLERELWIKLEVLKKKSS